MLKTERLLETVFLLLDKRKVTAEELATRFGVSKRTVLRDMESAAQVIEEEFQSGLFCGTWNPLPLRGFPFTAGRERREAFPSWTPLFWTNPC